MAEGTTKKDKPGVMVLHKRQDGSVEGQRMPDQHVLSARFVARNLGEMVEVLVTMKTAEGDKTYRLEGFDPVDPDDKDSDLNFTAWQLTTKGV